MKIANENDRLAIRMEDDPYQWWVSKQPIELEGLNYQVAMSNWLREMLENEPEGATNSKGNVTCQSARQNDPVSVDTESFCRAD